MKVTEELRKLRQRSGLSMAELAKLIGYRTASGYQRYEDDEGFTKEYLSLTMTNKLSTALVGRGNPPIEPFDVLKLSGIVANSGEEFQFKAAMLPNPIPIIQSDQLHAETLEKTRDLIFGREPDRAWDRMANFTFMDGVEKGAFCVDVADNSMSSKNKNEVSIEEGDRVICILTEKIKPGDFVIGKRDIDDIYVLRRYRLVGHHSTGTPIIDLIPLNPDYPVLSITPEMPGTILARVKELRKAL